MIWRFLTGWCVSFLFPKRCIGCLREGAWICDGCLLRIPSSFQQECFFCHRPSLDGRCCFLCVKDHAVTGILALGVYRDELLRLSLHAFKYNGVRDFAPRLGERLRQAFDDWSVHAPVLDHTTLFLTSVPLSQRRLRTRGFNQAALIAEELAHVSGIPFLDTLERIRFSRPQTELSPRERHKNVQGVFQLREGAFMRGKTVFIVDDVATTGATLDACARVLRDKGAKEVWGVVLASGG